MIIRVEKDNRYSSKVRTLIDICSDNLTYFFTVILFCEQGKKYFKITEKYEYKRNCMYGNAIEISYHDLLKYINRKNELHHYRNRPLIIKEEEVSKLLKHIVSKYPLEPWVAIITNEVIPYDHNLLYRFISLVSC
jgi:hypothetical protein